MRNQQTTLKTQHHTIEEVVNNLAWFFFLLNSMENYMSVFDKSTQICLKWKWKVQATGGELRNFLGRFLGTSLAWLELVKALWPLTVLPLEGDGWWKVVWIRLPVVSELRRFPGFLQVLQRELNHEREVKEGAGLFKGKALEGWRNEVTQPQCGYQRSTWQANPDTNQSCSSEAFVNTILLNWERR